jgi:hypothetical protein
MSNSEISKKANAYLKALNSDYLALKEKISAPLTTNNSMRQKFARNFNAVRKQMDLDFNAIKAKLAKGSKKLNMIQGLFDLVREKARLLRQINPKADGLAFWKPIKETLSNHSDIVASGFKKLDPRLTATIMELPEKIINGYGEEKMIELNHFMIQSVRIPIKEKPTLQKILQIALNLGQYEGLQSKPDSNIISLNLNDYLEVNDIIQINKKITDEVMRDIVRISVLE